MTADLVVLVPGFLGFEAFGAVAYFADRLALSEELARALDVRVEIAPTVPAGALADRQAVLLAQLVGWNEVHAPSRIHLVGHSTGGLDAELLTRARPCNGSAWSTEAADVRAKLRSVVTCAAPLAGTWLAASELGELAGALGREGILTLLHRPGANAAAWLGLSAALGAATNPAVVTLLRSLFTHPHRAVPFLASVWTHRELIAELHPPAMPDLYARVGARTLDVRRLSAVTVAPPAASLRPTLYAALDCALRRATPHDGEARIRGRRLERASRAAITAGTRPALDAGASDGVVNTHLQWLDTDPILLVVADHLDILAEAATGAAGVFSNLLESASGYGPREARILRGHLVRTIASAAEARPSTVEQKSP